MLSLVNSCRHYSNDCDVCNKDWDKASNPNYVAALYGWEDGDTSYIKPYSNFDSYEKEMVDMEMPLVPSLFWNSSGDDAIIWRRTDSDSDSETYIE